MFRNSYFAQLSFVAYTARPFVITKTLAKLYICVYKRSKSMWTTGFYNQPPNGEFSTENLPGRPL